MAIVCVLFHPSLGSLNQYKLQGGILEPKGSIFLNFNTKHTASYIKSCPYLLVGRKMRVTNRLKDPSRADCIGATEGIQGSQA